MYELHFAVPMAGALLYTLKIRHDLAMVSTLLKHSGAKLIFVDYQFLDVAKGALEIISKSLPIVPQLVLIPYDEKMEELMEEAYEQYLTKKEGTTKQRTDEEKARGRVYKVYRLLEFFGVEVSKKTLDWLQSKHVEVKLEQTINLEDVADGSKAYKTSAGETIKADCVFLCLGKPLASSWLKKNILRDSLDANWSNDC
ncbi:hypothetical protein Tco_0682853 [Tanacetum coccineum]|uniref:Uncharacterized protein n=1 Tax=Tanacetum coccineum TaxID=301880 RepID=A0ABQ4XTS0_9ASTR